MKVLLINSSFSSLKVQGTISCSRTSSNNCKKSYDRFIHKILLSLILGIHVAVILRIHSYLISFFEYAHLFGAVDTWRVFLELADEMKNSKHSKKAISSGCPNIYNEAVDKFSLLLLTESFRMSEDIYCSCVPDVLCTSPRLCELKITINQTADIYNVFLQLCPNLPTWCCHRAFPLLWPRPWMLHTKGPCKSFSSLRLLIDLSILNYP